MRPSLVHDNFHLNVTLEKQNISVRNDVSDVVESEQSSLVCSGHTFRIHTGSQRRQHLVYAVRERARRPEEERAIREEAGTDSSSSVRCLQTDHTQGAHSHHNVSWV